MEKIEYVAPYEEAHASLYAIFQRLHSTARAAPFPSLEARRGWLHLLDRLLVENSAALAQATSVDFGHRSVQDTQLAELFPLRDTIRYTKRQLVRWMRPQRRRVSHWFWPAKNYIFPQPLGVVGIIVPWNYPIYLALSPLVMALAAGNRVMIKMSEYIPKTAELIQRLAQQYFGSELVSVVTGDIHVAQAFSRLPFDHLLFTGSPATGRRVMQAAAEHLTPLTLELGGKTPVIVTDRAHFKRAASAIVRGKMLNAGQTCVAPDYVLVAQSCREPLIRALQETAAKFYPTLLANADYTSIINDTHYERLTRWLEQAEQAGASILRIKPDSEPIESLISARKFPFTLVWDCPDELTLMQNEIFGPILPIVTYEKIEDALDYINTRARPLALYLFTNDSTQVRQIITSTVSGGVAVNDTLLHAVQVDLPFGGVGASGWGQLQGWEGFCTFSKIKPIFQQSQFSLTPLLRPPYHSKIKKYLVNWLMGR